MARIATEYRSLAATEQRWLNKRLEAMETAQQRLQQLFNAADGAAVCRRCRGDCCAHGHNHMTLANVLSYLRRGGLPPEADFSRTCPFLGRQGCSLTAAGRPYNCITFICDKIEHSLQPADKKDFYRLDKELRELYRQLAQRYTGAAMTGLLIREQRQPGRPFLARTEGVGR